MGRGNKWPGAWEIPKAQSDQGTRVQPTRTQRAAIIYITIIVGTHVITAIIIISIFTFIIISIFTFIIITRTAAGRKRRKQNRRTQLL